MLCHQKAGGLCNLACGVLDRLALIKYHIIEAHTHQQFDITAQGTIGSDGNIMVHDLFLYTGAGCAMMDTIGQGRCELAYLIFPVIDQCGWTNHQCFQVTMLFSKMLEEGKSLYCFTQTH